MTKRVISVILSVVLIFEIFSCLSSVASATEYTPAQLQLNIVARG